MKINPSIAANFFLKKGSEENIPISLMKLLKLVFIAHGWVLALLDNRDGILADENIEAWKHGPVIPSLYHEFKRFKDNPIDVWSQTTTDETDSNFELKPLFLEKESIADKSKLLQVFDAVWEAYKEYSAWGLSRITHEVGTPWQKTYKEDSRFVPIPNDLIESYFKIQLQDLAREQ